MKEPRIERGIPQQTEQRQGNASQQLESTLEGLELSNKSAEHARFMAQSIDRYVSESYIEGEIDKRIEKMREREELRSGHIDEAEIHKVRKLVRARIERARSFFVQPREEYTMRGEAFPNAPVTLIARALERIQPTESSAEYEEALAQYMDYLMELAFEQHWRNPEKYISHDFSHGLNTAMYAVEFARAFSENGELRDSTVVHTIMDRYNISEGEAVFVLFHSNMCHDCGYPHLGGRSKSVHALTSADAQDNERMSSAIEKMITSPGANKELLLRELYEAALYHGADVASDSYSIRISTNRGEFLATPETVADVLDYLQGGGDDGTMERTIEHIDVLSNAQSQSEFLIRKTAPNVPLSIIEQYEPFIGRSIDMREKDDKRIGVEFRDATIEDAPLLAMLRISDNLDIARSRAIPAKRHPDFFRILKKMGNGEGISQLFHEMEGMVKAGQRVPEERYTEMISEVWGGPVDMDVLAFANTPERQRIAMRERLTWRILRDSELPYYREVDSDDPGIITKDRIAEVAAELGTYDLKHMGGSLAIENIDMSTVEVSGEKTMRITVTVNEHFDDLRKLQILEQGYRETGTRVTEQTTVAEYKVWRLINALATNHVGMPSEVYLVYEDGTPVAHN